VAAGVTAEPGGKEPDSDPGSEPADTPTEQRDGEEGLGK
jgi:hypothetical protein